MSYAVPFGKGFVPLGPSEAQVRRTLFLRPTPEGIEQRFSGALSSFHRKKRGNDGLDYHSSKSQVSARLCRVPGEVDLTAITTQVS